MDSDSRLWISTIRGICEKSNLTDSFLRYSLTDGSDWNGECWGMVEYAGKQYAYGFQGLYEINRENRTLASRLSLGGISFTNACEDGKNHLWLSVKNELVCVDQSLNVLSKIKIDDVSTIKCLFLISENLIYVGTEKGIRVLHTQNLSLKRLPAFSLLDNTKINSFYATDEGQLIICTLGEGVLFYDFQTGKISRNYKWEDFAGLYSQDVTTAFLDRNKNLWLGTFDSGAFVFSNRMPIFNNDKKMMDFFNRMFITRVTSDADSNLLVGTRYKGLYYGSSQNGFRHVPLSAKGLDFIQELYVDSKNRVWIGVNQSLMVGKMVNGVFSSLARFDDLGNVVSIAEDASGQIWIGTDQQGLYVFHSDITLKRHLVSTIGSSNNITKVIPFSKEEVLVSVYTDDLYKVNIHNFLTVPLDAACKNQWNTAITLLIDTKQKLWVGTYGNGLLCYDLQTANLESFLCEDEFLTNDVVSIEVDTLGYVWCGSSYGIYKLNLTDHSIVPYYPYSGTNGYQYHEKCSYKGKDGKLYFGGNAGLEEIIPQNAFYSEPDIPIYLTKVTLMDKEENKFDESETVIAENANLKKLILDYNENYIALDFKGVCYETDGHLQYAFRLRGFEEKWNYANEYTRAIYTNLKAGDYQFEVKVRTYDGEWNNERNLVDIKVKVAPWLHPLAWSAYVLLLLMVIYYGNKFYLRWKLKEERYALAETRVEQEHNATQMKINFFTNISHELRTPLTLIYSPLKTLTAHYHELEEWQLKAYFGYLNRNVERLFTLVNQLLNVKNIQNETLPLRVCESDCVAQLSNIVRIYKVYVAEKRLNIMFDCPYETKVLLYDPDKLEKIVNNLLINATKYTLPGGSIVLKMCVLKYADNAMEHNFLEVSVKDNGIGVEAGKVKELFKRFRRMVSIQEQNKTVGFGIGLNFVQHLVEMHKGEIHANKNIDGGMTFTVKLPIDKEVYAADELCPDRESQGTKGAYFSQRGMDGCVGEVVTEMGQKDGGEHYDEKLNRDEKPYKILIIEDDLDMNAFLVQLFFSRYKVECAYDGEEGLRLTSEFMPDVIVSDVLMPGMDGYELCAKIKEDRKVCHIPVVLLTAKTMSEEQIKGYEQGADLYMSKPFNPDVLVSAIQGIISRLERQREYLMAVCGKTSEGMKEGKRELSPLDKAFLDKLYEYIEENLSNDELNVNSLSVELGYSRTNFYRKVKALTGITPNELLKVYRLNRAAELILTRQYMLNEISALTGFGTQSHFSSSFKSHFGVSPKNYAVDNKVNS